MKMSMFFIVFALFLALCNAASFKNCGNGNPVQLHVKQFPDPILLRSGANIHFGFTVEVKSPVGSSYKISLNLQKKTWGFWVYLPCLAQFGSCTYDLDCQKIAELGHKGICPLTVGNHPFNDITVKLPNINIPSFLAGGEYYVKAEIKDAATNNVIGCGEAYANIST